MGNWIQDSKSGSQKIANWICSDVDNNLPIYVSILKNHFKVNGIPFGVYPQINDNHIYLWTNPDMRGMLIAMVRPSSCVDYKDTPQETIESWSDPENFDIPNVYEGILHDSKHADPLYHCLSDLIDYDFITARIRDHKLDGLGV